MRLFLASFRTANTFERLVAMAGPGARVAVVSNAVDFIPPDQQRAYRERIFDPVAQFAELGLAAHDLDLRDHFGRPPEALEAALADIDLVWTVGGNGFLLRRAIAQSGLEPILRRRLAEDTIIYGGWSAGACVAGSTLRGIEIMDEPHTLAPGGYDPEPIWEGLGLVPYAIVPHSESDHPEADGAARTAAFMTASGIDHRTLRDGDAIIVDS